MTERTIPEEKFLSLLRDLRTVMLVTQDNDAKLSIRPMHVAKVENSGRLWFASSIHSLKTADVREHPTVYITAEKNGNCYITARGQAMICDDKETARKLWSEPMRVWFPKGADDPELALIRVDLQEGEYWDLSGGEGLRYYISAFAAYMRSERPNVDEPSQHATVRIS